MKVQDVALALQNSALYLWKPDKQQESFFAAAMSDAQDNPKAIVVGGGINTGKTLTQCVIAVRTALEKPGSSIAIIVPSLKDVRGNIYDYLLGTHPSWKVKDRNGNERLAGPLIPPFYLRKDSITWTISRKDRAF
ncbi:MAG: hypothetical protein L0Y56_02380, partial [Nitrospira sp.]|nr:hypothetical protein [Nitrospira sp.]